MYFSQLDSRELTDYENSFDITTQTNEHIIPNY